MASNKSQRIYLNTGTTLTDKYIQVKLEEEVDTIEFMSMNIYTKDAYQDFNSDYGVLVGRVIANGGIGIPNAKISIFIPLTDADAEDGDIASIYPYKNPRNKNAQGKRYNLLPRVSEYNPKTGTYSPKQPFGSFPIKPEIVTNQSFLDVYKKYYKYTALTNNAGDYMIFGVPIGVQTVHLSVDITDIGKYSMTPASMVTNLGYSPNLFYDNNSKIKPSEDLGDLPNIETQEISVNIVPFWGDTTNFIIGITRQDFRIRSVLNNTFVIFGSAFTDDNDSMYGSTYTTGVNISELYEISAGVAGRAYNSSAVSKRIGVVTEKIYYYPASVSDARLDVSPSISDVDPITEMLLLDPSEYSVYKRDGDFAFIINCNRNKVVTNELGQEIPVADDSKVGIFTKFRGFLTLTISTDTIPMDFVGTLDTIDRTRIVPIRYIYKFPQSSPPRGMLWKPENDSTENINQIWRREHKIFSGGTLYGVAQFYGTTVNGITTDTHQFPTSSDLYLRGTIINKPYAEHIRRNIGIIQSGTGDGIDVNEQFEFPSNSISLDENDVNIVPTFGANWLNFTTYFPQVGWAVKGYTYLLWVRIADNFQQQHNGDTYPSKQVDNYYFLVDNTQPIAAHQYNTKWLARSDLHWTDLIAVPKEDIIKISEQISKGIVTSGQTLSGGYVLKGNYRNGNTPCPYNGGKLLGNPAAAADPNIYIYKGLNTSNCLEYLISLGLI